MNKTRRLNSTYTLTVEGECEKYYFEHLLMLINNESTKKKTCVFKPSISFKKPLSTARGISNKSGVFFHIQDVEDYNDTFQKDKFNALIKEISDANKISKDLSYTLGYSNFTFELWMLLHKVNFNSSVAHRDDYLLHINNAYCTNFSRLKEYKSESEFKKILQQITLDDIRVAIKRAESIRSSNENGTTLILNQKKITLNKYEFYSQNPDLDIHKIVQKIINDCI